MRLLVKFQTFYFFYEEILHIKKALKTNKRLLLKYFYTPKKHKKHKKQLLLIKNIKNKQATFTKIFLYA